MNDKQPDALRLADTLDEGKYEPDDSEFKAAVMLRTQHAAIERKDALLRQALEVLELARSYCGVGHVEAACDKSTEAIKQELSQ